MIKMPVWSVSKYRLFKNCPWAFYLRYIEKRPTRFSAALEKGRAVHLALNLIVTEMIKQDLEPLKSAEVTRIIQEAYAEEVKNPDLHLKSVSKEIRSMVKGALDKIDFKSFQSVIPERKFEVPLDDKGHVLQAYLDLFAVMFEGMIYLIDYKTGKLEPSEGNIQLETYAAVTRASGYEDATILGSLFSLVSLELDPVIITKEQSDRALELHRETVEDVERRLRYWIVEDAFPATPGLSCKYCSYSGECPKGNNLGMIPFTVEDMTPEQAKHLAEWQLVVSRSLEKVNELLKEYSSREPNGAFILNGGYFGNKVKKSMEWRVGQVLDLLKVHEVDDSVFRNITLNSSKLSSYLNSKKNAKFGEILRMVGEEKTRNYFGYYEEYLLDKTDEDEETPTEDRGVA